MEIRINLICNAETGRIFSGGNMEIYQNIQKSELFMKSWKSSFKWGKKCHFKHSFKKYWCSNVVLCNASSMLKAHEYSQISFKIWLSKANSRAVIVQNTCASMRDVCATLNCKLTASSGTMWLHLCWPQCAKPKDTLKIFVLPVLALALYTVASESPMVCVQRSSLGLCELSLSGRSSLRVGWL